MIRLSTLLCCLLMFCCPALADELPVGGFSAARPTIDGTPGMTCLNVVTITNQTGTAWPLRLRATIPPKLHLLSQIPAHVSVPAHGSLSLPVKLLVDRQWTDEEATVRIDAFDADTTQPAVSVQFTVRQSRSGTHVFSVAFLNDRPYLSPGQDTLDMQLQLVNDNYQPRNLRLSLQSAPNGFVLPASLETLLIGARRDTLVRLPVLARSSLKWSQSYDLVLNVFDRADGTLLGIAICRPVLLTAVKSQVVPSLPGGGPNGVMLGLTRLGRFGYFREVRAWGQQTYAKGKLDFQLDALSFTTGDRQLTDFRDTYVQYQRANGLLRIGSLYDHHELPLMGIGVKASVTTGKQRLEGWAVSGRNSFLHKQAYSFYSSTYSLQLTGPLGLGQGGTYSLSTSQYTMNAFGRAGWLSFGTAAWQPSINSRVRLLAAGSTERGTQPTARQQTTGWALGGDYQHTTDRLTFTLNTYFSNPVYGGYQRGLSRYDQFISYRLGTRTSLSHQLSLLTYNQRFIGMVDGASERYFGNKVANLTLTHQIGRVGISLRPYYWMQTQTLSGSIRQSTDTYRLLTLLHYEPRPDTHLEVGVDGGRYRGLTPATDLYEINSFRFLSTFTYRTFSLFGLYQRGPYLINDRLPGSGDPANTRQIMVAPAWAFSFRDGRLQGGLGASVSYTTQNHAWNGIIRHSVGWAVNENLRFRGNVNLFSTASQLAELQPAAVENALVSLEVIRQFQSLKIGTKRSIKLRFYEDGNANHQRDGNDPWIDGLVVHLRTADGQEIPLLTDSKGTVTYKTSQPGLYIVKAVCRLATSEPVLFTDSIRLDRNVDRQMPIRKTWPVKGTLLPKHGRFDDGPASLDSYRVEARAADGELLRTYADERGRFTLFLPVGEYQVSVINSRSYPPRPLTTVAYRVAAGTEPGAMPIEFESGGRPVQIKRFSSR